MTFPPVKQSIMALLGPSFIFVALSVSGGELLLWPELISKYGVGLMWVLPIVLFLQFSVNLEIERYTLTTGKNTLTSLSSYSWITQYIVISAIIISLVWPAWIVTSGSMISYLFGVDYSQLISIVLLCILLLIWNYKKSYSIIENLAKISIFVLLFIGCGIVAYLMFTEGRLPYISSQLIPNDEDSFSYVAALAFGGVTGVLNLVQSDWITSKKYGATNLTNPSAIDYESKESQSNWKKWWKLIRLEHFILFYVGNIVAMLITGLIAGITLLNFGGTGFGILRYQVDLLNSVVTGLGIFWGLAIIGIFTMAQITILDAGGKLLSRIEMPYLKSLSPSQLSQIIGFIGIAILIVGFVFPWFTQPSYLLKTSAVLSGATMALYPPFILLLNNKLPTYARPSLFAKISVIACSLVYGGVVLWMLMSFVG